MFWLILSLISCSGIVIEDFKNRLVHLYWFLLLMIGLVGLHLSKSNWLNILYDASLNLIFLFVLFIFLFVYFSIKEKKLINLFNQHIGIGDLLFFLVISIYFTFPYYILFFTISLVFSLLFLPIIFYFQGRSRDIPLAGLQAMVLIFWMLLDRFNGISFTYLNIVVN